MTYGNSRKKKVGSYLRLDPGYTRGKKCARDNNTTRWRSEVGGGGGGRRSQRTRVFAEARLLQEPLAHEDHCVLRRR